MRSLIEMLTILLIVAAIAALGSSNPYQVRVQQGLIHGNARVTFKRDKFYSFQGIPYGEPPIGSLRFQPPIPAKNWMGTLDATQEIAICAHGLIGSGKVVGQEDCLQLSVFTRNPHSTILRPVMVYFYGGGFLEGDATDKFLNPCFLMDKDIVLVKVAYRLGMLGFCSIRNNVSSLVTANAALKDQSLGLRWVQQNIRQFGGHPNRVTIFGNSAGSASTMFQLLSPSSRGLFQGVIAESGVPMNHWAIGQIGSGKEVAEFLGLNASVSGTELLEALQNQTLENIFYAQAQIYLRYSATEPGFFAPVVEGDIPNAFLPQHPIQVIESGNFPKIPIVMGYNTLEGLLPLFYLKTVNQFTNIYNIMDLIPNDIYNNNNETVLAEIKSNIVEFYFQGHMPQPFEVSKSIIDLISDSWFMYGIQRAALMLAKQTTVYFYRFSVESGLNYFKHLTIPNSDINGASHVDELGYLFGTVLTPNFTTDSLESRKIDEMITLWTNFAEYSIPNLFWKPMLNCSNDIRYLEISNEYAAMKWNPDPDRVEFWNNIYHQYTFV